MTIFNKVKWVASILLVFFIVLFTNLIDRDNFESLSNSITTIYEDRIVASDLLFDMSQLIHKKELSLVATDDFVMRDDNTIINQELDNLLLRYQETKLTEREKILFSGLKKDIEAIKAIERDSNSLNKSKMLAAIDNLRIHLYDLSKLQVQESRQQVLISDKAKDRINLFTQWEIIFLILLTVVIQIVIFYSPVETNKS